MEQITASSTRRSMVRVCVDGFRNYELYGRIESPLIGSVPFQGVLQLIEYLESFYNRMRFPMSTFQLRTFQDSSSRRRTAHRKQEEAEQDKPRPAPVEGYREIPGKEATFVVHVIFRQNATWQGRIQWVEGGQTRSFRSLLEMLALLKEASTGEGRATSFAGWDAVGPEKGGPGAP